MAKKYEYHKRNDYPGERVAEKKRVADRAKKAEEKADERVAEKAQTEKRRANARVAKKSRKDDKLMKAEKQRSADEAEADRKKNIVVMIGLVIIAGLAIFLLAGSF